MNRLRSLSVKIILLAFLNVALLVCVVATFAHLAFRVDFGSFLMSATRDRILSVSRLIALDLANKPAGQWTQLLKQSAKTYPARFSLFDSFGAQLAGESVALPESLAKFVTADSDEHDHHASSAMRGEFQRRDHGPSGPPSMFTASRTQNSYWVGARIPVWRDPNRPPVHGALVWSFPSLWTNSFFFDYRPWLLCALAVVVVSLVCWVPLIRSLMRSISEITRATGQIAEGHFEIALSTARRDELGQLSRAINRMAERLSGYVHGQKRFLSDVAHELCSPVARMQMALGILEQRATTETATYVEDVQEEAAQMSTLINELLSFSKSQLSTQTAELTRVSVADTVDSVLEREATGAVQVETSIARDVDVIAQPDYLFRSLANLVRNAIRYAGHAGPIEVSAVNSGSDVSIVVADHGPGLPEAELDEVFKPFYRPEFARQRETGGTGLGLAIVKSCVEACGGVVLCRNRAPHGLQVEIRLPAASRA